jgi:hypothetical protein
MKFIQTFLKEVSEIKQRKKDLRSFGIIIFFAGLVIDAIIYWKHGLQAKSLFIYSTLGSLFLITGLLIPNLLKPIHKIWMILAVILGFIMTKLIMTLTFILIVTPIGLLLKLSGKDLLNLKIKEKENTFWKDYQRVENKDRYTKMF